MSDWVILELGPMAEEEDPAVVAAAIRHLVKGAEVFIPASVTQIGDDRVITYLVDGYAFIRRDLPDERYFKLEDTRYVQAVVRAPGQKRKLATITDRDIDKFRRQIRVDTDQGINVGDIVTVTSGPYKHLNAEVVEDIPEHDSVQVRIELRSKDSLVSLPRSFLRLVQRAEVPAYVEKARDLRAWFDSITLLASWNPGFFGGVLDLWGQVQDLYRWVHQGRVLQAAIRLEESADRLMTIRALANQYNYLNRWISQGQTVQFFLWAFSRDFNADPVRLLADDVDRLTAWSAAEETLNRDVELLTRDLSFSGVASLWCRYRQAHEWLLRLLWLDADIRALERQMTSGSAIDNIVVDGLNMAVRCAMAPGLSELRDTKGRPTGAIVGFLNALSGLRKKHPTADIWVCWDSPSERRKSLFSDYKANRNPMKATFEVGYIKEVLASLGVWQVSAHGEEADDVIATLVGCRLAGQRNLIVSTDRDFLQLVTETDHVLVPAVGAGRERLYTPAEVRQDYGVSPSGILHLRALGGDPSDNIPGAPGCGHKTAAKLLAQYGTVDGVFSSSLVGISPSLCTKLRGAEQQVRLNLQLMCLVRDLPLDYHDPCADEASAGQYLNQIKMNPSRVFPAFFGHSALEA